MMTECVGFIGLGRMGSGMASHLTGLDEVELRVFDANPALAVSDAIRARSPEEIAAQCTTVFLCLPSASQVRDVLFGEVSILGQACRAVIDTSTMDRDDAIAIAGRCAEMDVDYCDCPVSGMPFRASEGTLTSMFGGSAAAFERYRRLIERYSKTVIHGGPVGSGQALKALNNIIYNVNIAALCEVLPMAVAMGLDVGALEKLVTSGSSQSFASDYFVPRMLKRRFDSDFAMQDAYKDILNVRSFAKETGAALPVVEAMIGVYDAALEAGFGAEPKSAMIKVHEKRLGAVFEEKS